MLAIAPIIPAPLIGRRSLGCSPRSNARYVGERERLQRQAGAAEAAAQSDTYLNPLLD
jgi:hypothetical protein